jgi:hypothetical protein
VPIPRAGEGVGSAGAFALSDELRALFAGALHQVFVAGAVVSALGLLATLFLPEVDFTRGVRSAAGEELLAAEMTNLEPDDEPIALRD